MKKLLILLLLCNCANIPEERRMKCTKIDRGIRKCENNTITCFKTIHYDGGFSYWSYSGCKDKEK